MKLEFDLKKPNGSCLTLVLLMMIWCLHVGIHGSMHVSCTYQQSKRATHEITINCVVLPPLSECQKPRSKTVQWEIKKLDHIRYQA